MSGNTAAPSLIRSNSFSGPTSASKRAAPAFSFGPTPSQPAVSAAAPAASTTPMFGAGAQQNKPAGGFSFGAAPPTGPAAAPAATTGAFSFGGATTQQPAAAPATGGFSFGGAPQQQQQQQQAAKPAFSFGGSTFGQPQQSAPTGPSAGGGFSFGQPQQHQQQQQQQQQQQGQAGGGGLFGGFGTGAFGQQQQQPQQQGLGASQAGGTAQGSSPFASHPYYQKERFNDLPEPARKLVEELDNHISSQIRIRDELRARDLGAEDNRKGAELCANVDFALQSLQASLDADAQLVKDLSKKVEDDRASHATLHEIAQNAKSGQSDGRIWRDWPLRFFTAAAEDFRERIDRYRSTMEQIERHLTTVENREKYSPQAISDVIHAQNASFMALANRVASLHSDVESLKREYRTWYQQQNRSIRDPFAGIPDVSV